MPLDLRRTQLAIATGSAGSYNAAVESAANATMLLYEANFELQQEFEENLPMRESIGALVDTPGQYIGELTFKTPIQGSGVAGTAAAVDVALQIAAMSSTVNSGTMVVGAVTASPRNAGTVAPTAAGTNVVTENGRLVVTVETVVTNTSVLMRLQWQPSDGTGYETEVLTQTSATPVTAVGTELAGVTIDFGDPSTSTAGIIAGDQFTIPLTSASSVQVDYVPINTAIPVADLALYEDGRIIKMHSCQATARLVFNIGQRGMYEFTIMGAVEAIVDGAILSGIAYDNVSPPAFKGVTAAFHGATPQCFTNLVLDIGNVLAPIECATEASGFEGVRITGRRSTYEIDPLGAVVADSDVFNKMLLGTTGNLTLDLGATSGNIVTWVSSIAQILSVSEGDRTGLRVDSLTGVLAEPFFDAGGDYSEFVMVHK